MSTGQIADGTLTMEADQILTESIHPFSYPGSFKAATAGKLDHVREHVGRLRDGYTNAQFAAERVRHAQALEVT